MSIEIYQPDFPTEIVEEGNVRIIIPRLKAFAKSPSDYAPSKAPVFYNPVMELNRDLAVLAVQAYRRTVNHDVAACEALAGCGVMGTRFAAEVKGVRKVVMADINERAARLANRNVQLNNLVERATVEHEDANLLLSRHGAPHRRFDVIDIDPFGSPSPYVDSAIRALRNNGLLALTATDMAPLCGVHPRACIRKYGGRPLRTEYCHELAVRLLAGSLASVAAKHDIGIAIVFSHSSDHYVRVYAKIRYGAKKADESIGKMGFVLHCFRCLHRETRKKVPVGKESGECPECGSQLSLGGPLWLGEIADKQFVGSMEEEANLRVLKFGHKITQMLALVKEESNAPFSYYEIDKICNVLSLPVPPVRRVADSLKNEGFVAFLTHFSSRAIKSNAPAMSIRSIVRELAG